MKGTLSRWKWVYVLLFLCFPLAAAIRFGPVAPEASAANASGSGVQTTPTPTTRGQHNGRLVFISNRHNSALSIWSVNPDGSSPTRLTDDSSRTERLPSFVPVYDGDPAWSPDGMKIAFTSNRDYTFALYTMNADGSNVQLVTDQVQDPGRPSWSPDGRKIAFSGGVRIVIGLNQPSADIYLVNVDGSALTKLTSSVYNESPTWSPDGRQIAFSSNRDGAHKIYVMNADGTNQHAIAERGTQPSWSPDGSKILFVGGPGDATQCGAVSGSLYCEQLYSVSPDGSDLTQLTHYAASYERPKWSPDGTKIVFARNLTIITIYDDPLFGGRAITQHGYTIFVMNADGTNQTNISNREAGPAVVDAQADWQPLPGAANQPLPSVLSFSASSYSAYEDSGSIQIIVKRTGNLNEAVSCDYASVADSTIVLPYFAPAFGMLSFAPGETMKKIAVPLTDSAYAQGDVSFKIKLINNKGNATFVGGIREATVTVLDKDSVPRANNPIDDAQAFVRQHYVDFLNREPDPEGLAFWTNEIASCGTDAQCLDIKRQHVSAAFFLSIEFQETGYFVLRYRILNPYNSEYPSEGFLGFARYAQEVGRGVVVGQPGWQDQLEANKRAFIQRFFDDDRVVLDFGRTDQEYVDLLFQYVREFTGVTLPQSERDLMVAGLEVGTETRPTVFRKVLENEDFQRGFFNQAFVLMQYYGYLRREPDEAGFNFWLNKLEQFGGNYIAAEMVKAFIVSGEYRNRFGPT